MNARDGAKTRPISQHLERWQRSCSLNAARTDPVERAVYSRPLGAGAAEKEAEQELEKQRQKAAKQSTDESTDRHR